MVERAIPSTGCEKPDRSGAILSVRTCASIKVTRDDDTLRFASEPGNALLIVRERRGQHFDGHLAVQSRVTRTKDLAHPAGTDRPGDLIRAEART